MLVSSLLRRIEYPAPTRALDKWARTDLTCEPAEDGTWQCRYVYTGSTCNDGGKAFVANFHVTLRPGPDGMIIERAWVDVPLGHNAGATEMCAYVVQPESFLRELRADQPFCGMTLEAAILRPLDLDYAGCLCYARMLNHKWRNVLSTIHYALIQQTTPAALPSAS
ncbi:MAG: hypothetical protein RMN25_06745 [Anaerolineae bacterium]|nr:hypothetical protein [Thermoflexales bacterium]MDW8407468.1 hypothetical protein [Anaerolineae bacterium]